MTNMFQKNSAESVDEYIKILPNNRRDIIVFLNKFIEETSPKLRSYFAYNMIGYGEFDYVNYKKEIVKWPTVALASQKNYISIYICVVTDGNYLTEKYKDRLGEVNIGKSCIRFKKIEDLNLDELRNILKESTINL